MLLELGQVRKIVAIEETAIVELLFELLLKPPCLGGRFDFVVRQEAGESTISRQ